MATWLFEFNLGAGYVDKTSLVIQETLDRRMDVHKDLRPTTNEVNFQVGPDPSFVNALMAGGADIPFKITKDGTRWFTGYVQRIPETSLKANLQNMSLKAYDPSILLKRKLSADYKKWGSTVSVVVGELLTLAGVTSQNLGTISKTIDAAAFSAAGPTYFDVIEKILSDFGYVLWFDETGTARTFLLFPSAAVSTKTYQTGETGNIIDELRVARKGNRYGGARVTFYRHDSRSNLIVFSDPTGAGGLKKCNIDLTGYPNGYPGRSGSEDVYCEYAVVENQIKRDLIATNSVTFDIQGTAMTVAQQVDYGLRAAVKITGSGMVTRLDIIAGSAILKGAQVLKESIISGVTEDLDDYQAEYITADADADFLISGRRAYWANSGVSFSFKTSDTVAIGAVVTIVDSTSLGYNLAALIVGWNEDDLGYKRVWCEALVPYAAQAVTTTGQAIQAPNPPNGIPIVQIADSTAPTVPAGLTVTQLSTGALRVYFTGSTDTESGVAIYRVYRRENGTTNEAVVNDVNAAGAGPFTLDDTSPKVGKSYQYAVSAVDARGNESAKTSWSSSLASVVSDPPGAVAGLQAAAVIGTSAVKWTAQTDAIAYQLEKSTDSGSTWLATGGWPLTVNTNSYADPIPAGTDSASLSTWRYRVKAISKDAVLSASYSSVASVTVASAWVYTPTAPTITGSIAKRSATLTLAKQTNLADPDGWDVQISRDAANWYAPNLQAASDADNWQGGALNSVLTVFDSIVNLDFLPIPLVSGLPTAAGQVYYLRARARGKNYGYGVFSSATSALVAYPGLYADLAAQQIKTANLDAEALSMPKAALVAQYPFDDIQDQPFTVTQDQGDGGYNVTGGTMSGGVFTKTATGVWGNARVLSRYSIGPGARVSFRPHSTGTAICFGLRSTPGSGQGWQYIDFAIYANDTFQRLYYMESGSLAQIGAHIWGAGDLLEVGYDGLNINYYQNGGNPIRSVYIGPGKTFYLDSDFQYQNSVADAISFSTDGLTYFQDAWETTTGWLGGSASTSVSVVLGKLKAVFAGGAGLPGCYFGPTGLSSGTRHLFAKIYASRAITSVETWNGSAWAPMAYTLIDTYSATINFKGLSADGFITVNRGDPTSFDVTLGVYYLGQGYQSALTDTSRTKSSLFLQFTIPTIGRTGKAVDFGGIGYGITQFPLGTKEVSFWFRVPSSVTGTTFVPLAGSAWPSGVVYLWRLFLGGGSSIRFDAYDGAGNSFLNMTGPGSQSAWNDGAWHHMAVAFGGSNNGFWIDGVRLTTSFVSGGLASAFGDAFISNRTSFGQLTFDSARQPVAIDEFRAYDGALSDAEVLGLYQNPTGGLSGVISAHQIIANSITARELAVGAVTADRIGVTNLDVDGSANVLRLNAELVYSAATALVGSAQGTRLLSSGPASGKYAYNYFDLTAGKFRVGDANNYLYYDGAGNLEMRLTTFKVSSLATTVKGPMDIFTTGTLEAPTNVLRLTSDATRATISHPARFMLNNPGVASVLYLGDDGTGKTQLILSTSADTNGYAALQAQKVSGTTVGDLVLQLSGGNVGVGLNNPSKKLDVSGTGRFSGDLTLSSTTTSSSTTTGALVVSGGVGVAGNLWVGGSIWGSVAASNVERPGYAMVPVSGATNFPAISIGGTVFSHVYTGGPAGSLYTPTATGTYSYLFYNITNASWNAVSGVAQNTLIMNLTSDQRCLVTITRLT